jgi:hypothetical protein
MSIKSALIRSIRVIRVPLPLNLYDQSIVRIPGVDFQRLVQ